MINKVGLNSDFFMKILEKYMKIKKENNMTKILSKIKLILKIKIPFIFLVSSRKSINKSQ